MPEPATAKPLSEGSSLPRERRRSGLREQPDRPTRSPQAHFQSFFRPLAAIFRPSSAVPSYRLGCAVDSFPAPEELMYDLAALAIAAACFAFAFVVLWVFGRV
jgi:hypothetical protein